MKRNLKIVLAAFVMILLLGFLPVREARADGIGVVDVASVTQNSVTIRWDKPTYNIENAKVTVRGYKLLYGTSPDKLQQYGKNLSASATKKKITGLSPKTQYYFQIKVYIRLKSETGSSSKDSTNYLETPLGVVTLPKKITNLQVTATNVSKKQAVIKWTAVNPAYQNFGYQYYVKTESGKKKASARLTTNGVRLKNISNTTCYYAKVRSFSKLANREGTKYFYGEWSDWIPILSDPLVIGAALPGGLLNVTWTEMKGVDGYDIYVFKEGWKKFYKAAYTPTGATSGTITKVNGKEFSPLRNTNYEISIVPRKNYGGKNYYGFGTYSRQLNIG